MTKPLRCKACHHLHLGVVCGWKYADSTTCMCREERVYQNSYKHITDCRICRHPAHADLQCFHKYATSLCSCPGPLASTSAEGTSARSGGSGRGSSLSTMNEMTANTTTNHSMVNEWNVTKTTKEVMC